MAPIRVAICGVGNCASALVQGVALAQAKGDDALQGVTYPDIGGYKPSDIDFVVAFDVDERKVGKRIVEAVFAKPNCCYEIYAETRNHTGWGNVYAGPRLDGVAPHMLAHEDKDATFVPVPEEQALSRDAILQLLREQRVQVLLLYLPVGSQKGSEFWAEICLEAGVALCCNLPVFIASDPAWEQRFVAAGLPVIGDDIRSQFGASVLSQMLQELAFDRGHKVIAHIQTNVGGNTDFLTMCDKSRLASKKVSKENVIRSQNDIRGIPTDGSFLYAGPSDYIAHYGDNKVATIRLELEGFGGAPVTLDARLSVQDSPNSAGIVLDAIRFLVVAREMGIVGALRGPSAQTQKSPPLQMSFADSKFECDELAARRLTDITRKQVKGGLA